jgi:hypothetical protein
MQAKYFEKTEVKTENRAISSQGHPNQVIVESTYEHTFDMMGVNRPGFPGEPPEYPGRFRSLVSRNCPFGSFLNLGARPLLRHSSIVDLATPNSSVIWLILSHSTTDISFSNLPRCVLEQWEYPQQSSSCTAVRNWA